MKSVSISTREKDEEVRTSRNFHPRAIPIWETTGGQEVMAPAPPGGHRMQSPISLTPLICGSCIIRRWNSELLVINENHAIFCRSSCTLRILSLSMELEQRLIICFLDREDADLQDIQARLSAQLGMLPIVCEASSAGAIVFHRGASFWAMDLRPAGRQLVFSTFAFSLALRNNLFTQPTHVLRS
jgi:hypothetical protein